MNIELKRWKEKYTDRLSAVADEEFFGLFGGGDAVGFLNDQMYSDPEKELCRAVIADDDIVGCIQLICGSGILAKNALVTFWLIPELRQQGCMTRALDQFCDMAFSRMGLWRITAAPDTENTAARHLLNSCGFELESTMKRAGVRNDQPCDLCCYVRLAGEEE